MKKIKFLILFILVPFCLSAQNISVSGTVKDANGEALIGVSVVEQGTSNGTATDFEGKYSLNVANNAVLQFLYIGYATQTINVQGRKLIDVVLADDTKALDEVVVIGYGTQRREAVTGSVASMRGDVLREVQTGNVSKALEGRLPGVQLSQT
ncbi:MAG: carboxypeptidase-like regulatory domain-containing protein, partial [Dysgonamonadaceae bacterium]|nr:carboxypeptidase-like regulatory domain-containing protein [Dysgonamonadaceae bacterium]